VGISLFCFFLLVVVAPLLRLTIGASLLVWWNHFAGVYRAYRARWRGEELPDEEEGTRGSKDSMDSMDSDAEASMSPATAASQTPASYLSRRESRASLGSQQSRRSSISGASAASFSLGRRASASSISLGRKKGVFGRIKAFVDRLIAPPKKKRRKQARSENAVYDASHFEEANMRAVAAQVEQVSTFSLMQVRDLHYRIPDPAAVSPPSINQPPVMLPGTPGGVAYSMSVPELMDRPTSPVSDLTRDPRSPYSHR